MSDALVQDLETLKKQTLSRRQMFCYIAGASTLLFPSLLNLNNLMAAQRCALIPTGWAGPYPADGSNGVNALKKIGIVRKDIAPSFGAASGVAKGVHLKIEMKFINGYCEPLSDRAIYVWHC